MQSKKLHQQRMSMYEKNLINSRKQPLFKSSWKNNLYINRFSKKSLKSKFINYLMYDGEKTKAYKLFNKAAHLIRKKTLIIRKTEQKITLLIENSRIINEKELNPYKTKPIFCDFSSEARGIGSQITIPRLYESKSKQNKKLGTLGQNNDWTLDLYSTNSYKNIVCPKKNRNSHSLILQYFITFSVTKSLFNSFDDSRTKRQKSAKKPKRQKSAKKPKRQKSAKKPKRQKSTKKPKRQKSAKKPLQPVISPPLETLLRISIENVKPTIEVRPVRIAGRTYQVPDYISKKRQETIAIRWIIESARKRKQNSPFGFAECLAQELVDAYNKQGHARQKRDELHKIALSNRVYMDYRWWVRPCNGRN